MAEVSQLDVFIEAATDEARLALGLDALQAAWNEAETNGLVGWAETVHEFVVAARDGKGLNRPGLDADVCPGVERTLETSD